MFPSFPMKLITYKYVAKISNLVNIFAPLRGCLRGQRVLPIWHAWVAMWLSFSLFFFTFVDFFDLFGLTQPSIYPFWSGKTPSYTPKLFGSNTHFYLLLPLEDMNNLKNTQPILKT